MKPTPDAVLDAVLCYGPVPAAWRQMASEHRDLCARAVWVKANPFEALRLVWLGLKMGRAKAAVAIAESCPEPECPMYNLTAA